MPKEIPNYDQRDIDDGQAVDRILKDEVFQRALARAKKRIVDRWILAMKPKEREMLHAQVVALELVVSALLTTSSDGKQAQQMKERQERSV